MSHFFSDTGLIFCILSPPVDDLLPFPSSFFVSSLFFCSILVSFPNKIYSCLLSSFVLPPACLVSKQQILCIFSCIQFSFLFLRRGRISSTDNLYIPSFFSNGFPAQVILSTLLSSKYNSLSGFPLFYMLHNNIFHILRMPNNSVDNLLILLHLLFADILPPQFHQTK